MKKIAITLSIITLLLISCKKEANSTSSKATKTDAASKKSTLNVDFSDSRYNVVYKQYILIKNALVKSDKEGVKKGSEYIGTAFANLGVDQSLMDIIANMIATDDIEVQREEFSSLSNQVTEMLSNAHIASGKIYKQYCPMAFDFKGAYWLSTEKEIRNPYFGDAMLKCGEVKEEIN